MNDKRAGIVWVDKSEDYEWIQPSDCVASKQCEEKKKAR